MPVTASQARYSTAVAHTGTHSVQVGLVPGQTASYLLSDISPQEHSIAKKNGNWVYAPAGATYSSVYQTISVPPSSYPVTLTFFYNAGTQDPGILASNGKPGTDVQQLLILDGSSLELLQEVTRTFTNTETWQPMTVNLSAYRGRSIAVGFEVLNTSTSDGHRDWMYIDDVNVLTCP